MRSQAEASAPGRVNLLGEHTDYNDGYVLPTVIPQRTRVAAERSASGRFVFESDVLDHRVDFTRRHPPRTQSARYVYGCLKALEAKGVAIPPLAIRARSEVPIGVGLSSSAALTVATLRAFRELLGLSLDDVTLARLAQEAEGEAGVHCGIMDPMACSLAEAGRALFIDTRTLASRLVELPAGSEILVVDSGKARALASSGYNQRRAECEEAAKRLGVASLRDLPDDASLEELAPRLASRVRHVVSENRRVLAAVEGVEASRFGELMNGSHASLRDDYEVSTPELDALVAALQAQPDVFGARLTGAGFGGACVALCRGGQARDAGLAALRDYDCAGRAGRVLVPSDASPA